MPHEREVIPLREFLGMAPPVGGAFSGDPRIPPRAMPLPSPTAPTSYDAARLFGRAFQGLPAWIQAGIARSIPQVSLEPGEVGGSALSEHAAVRFPSGVSTVEARWGPVAPEDVARHELAHVGLSDTLFRDPAETRRLIATLLAAFAADPGAFEAARRAHGGVAGLDALQPVAETTSVSDAVRSRGAWDEARARRIALDEYFASLLEHQGRPVRMPWPTPTPGDTALKAKLEAIRLLLMAPAPRP